MDTFDVQFSNVTKVADTIDGVKSLLLVLGIVGFVAALVAGIAILATSVHMGKENFQKFYGTIGSLVLLILGVVVIIIATTSMSSVKITDKVSTRTVSIIIIVVGVLMILVAICEFVIVCCMRDPSGCILVIYTVALLIITLAVTVVTVVLFALVGSAKVDDSFCDDLKKENDEYNNCDHYLLSLQTFSCEATDVTCKAKITQNDVIEIMNNVAKVAIEIVILPCLIILVVLCFVNIAACLQCRKSRKPKSDDEQISTMMPGYTKQEATAL